MLSLSLSLFPSQKKKRRRILEQHKLDVHVSACLSIYNLPLDTHIMLAASRDLEAKVPAR